MTTLVHGIQPTDQDLDWLLDGIAGRHTGGPEAWFKQNREELSFRDLARIVVTIWEAGRSKAGVSVSPACRKTREELKASNLGAYSAAQEIWKEAVEEEQKERDRP